ncbi:hypothetical protein SAMN05192561_10562 [Halopenitus malekzadehii]|uniref:Uncharacterized protein n=1 Tax=Halopenitus malekzadehii TaxID=1267564 RepID=A0A1H6IZ43_9EURY|nr:hypothetical protein [Halopenitus malekzadehii]SEH53522.1 hypothetical protein SAMN05192561_10562 [Halopenitus malekzadehii]
MRRVHNQTIGDDEAETSIKESTMTESNTDNTSIEAMTDGGTETIRDSDEVRFSNDDVRHHSADGYLYAYRENDEHVVVSRGRESRDRWTKRVPAERDAVLAGEHLWTIPENWQHRVKIKGPAEVNYRIYHIPESGVDVLVTVPNKTRIVDAWYGVKRVGTLNVTYDDEIAWDKLETTIEYVRDSEEVHNDVVEALETLNQRRRGFERKFASSVNLCAKEALLGNPHEPVTVHQWTAKPWADRFPVDSLAGDFLNLNTETRDAVVHQLSESNFLPSYPTVRVDVAEGEGIPDGYDVRALVEADASRSESIDYLITEHYDLMTQAHWAEIRGMEVSNINKNVNCAKKKLSD